MYTNSFNCFLFTMDMESFLCEEGSDFVGVFAKKFAKKDYEFIMSVCPSVRMEQCNSNSTDSGKISYL